MTTWGNADVLVEMLERQLTFLLKQQNERRILLLSSWLNFLGRESQIAGLTAEMMHETKSALSELTRDDHRIREKLESLWRAHGGTLRAMLADDLENEELHAYCHIDAFDQTVAKRPVLRLPRWQVFDENESETDELANALLHWAGYAVEGTKRRGTSAPEALDNIRTTAGELRLLIQFKRRKFRQVIESFPGAALHRLVRIVHESNPAPPITSSDSVDEPNRRIIRWTVFEKRNEFAAKVHSGASRELRALESDEVTHVSSSIAVDAQLVTHELQLRMLSGRSRLTLLRRYAARCEGFDATILRTMVATSPGKVENQLTLDFAKYLFEQGLTPILNPTLGGLRPDVVDFAPGGLLYVEAKQYGGPGSPRSRIISAYRQVWSTWGRLTNIRRIPEAFLLVFRVDGPRVELPEKLRHGDRVLYSILADISEEGGSKEMKNSVSFEASELLPESSDREPTTSSDEKDNG